MFKLLSFKGDGAFWPVAEHGGSPGIAGWVLAAPRRLLAAIAAEIAARRAIHKLAGLDDRILKDIGLQRDQIWHAARHGRDAARSRAMHADFGRW